jgi:hypothetical protein
MKPRNLFKLAILLLISIFAQNGPALAQQSGSGWTTPIDITMQDVSSASSSDVAVCDPYQNMHMFWADNSDTASSATIYYRTDISGNWSIPKDILLSDPAVYYLSAAVSGRDNTVHLAWSNDVGRSLLYYSVAPLVDAGNPRAWLKPVVLDENIFNPVVQVDPAGAVHIVYASSDEGQTNFDVLHLQSADGGITWSDPDIIFSTVFSQQSYIRIEMAIDGKGRIHVGLTQRSVEYGVYYEAGYVRSPDGGVTWDPYVVIDDTSGTFQGVEWIAPYAFGDDEIHLTWHDPRRLHQQSNNGGRTWSSPTEIMPLGAAFGGPNHLAKDSAGNLYAAIAWSDGVYVVGQDELGWGLPEQVDNRPIDPHGQHIVSCQGNQLHVIYWDRTGDTTVWYSSREVSTRHINRQPIPAANPQVVAKITQVAPLARTPVETEAPAGTPVPQFTAGAAEAGTEIPSAMRYIWMGILPAVVVIAAVVVFSVRRSRN